MPLRRETFPVDPWERMQVKEMDRLRRELDKAAAFLRDAQPLADHTDIKWAKWCVDVRGWLNSYKNRSSR